ncbi:T9SS type B sorting domain-containing protein [Lutibacter sp. TH_r2]|uniref:T9SS type B sorting domain-containing protein n=1 Tax=Lutibacter sp. TH_r2 TaxID=3082083 RepID=UPI0029547936|nr:T9SS type B sorting domain-containing protein [Lutibacter sp. TH_r2]MDV7187333.1 T9SS type B sorting domain-containing protein [Lutibacter sp. TH_r2]
MKNYIFCLLLLIPMFIFSQGEANNWYFGLNAGINFNGDTVTAITGSLSTNEGCSSFSDKDGNLLFYSDGTTVWNKNHNPMPNGNGTLKGHPSSTQSAIIVPHPGNSDLYYIFTVGARVGQVGEFGFHSYIVNMTLDGGLGDIQGGNTDLSNGLNTNWSEKVTSVKGSECNEFWVISLVSNTYYSYKIDLNGLNTTPVISTVDYAFSDRRGYLKVSPNGEKLASATFTQYTDGSGNNIIGNGKLHLYSFDDTTGIVSNNGIELINVTTDGAPYGVEFSPNSTKLYTSTFNGTYNKLYQFDIESTDIPNSKTLIKQQIGFRGGLQLAPNGKIYATVPVSYDQGTNTLDIIHEPDNEGIACNYETDGFTLNGMSMQGLPPFIASLLIPIEITDGISTENLNNTTIQKCIGDNLTLTPQNIEGSPVYKWFYNNIEISNSPNLTFTNLQLTDSGSYEIEISTVDDCGFNTTYKGSFEINVNELPNTFPTIIYNQCDIDSNSTDSNLLFNLNYKIEEITNNVSDLEVTFFENETDFSNDNFITSPENYQVSNSTTLIVKLTNILTGCYVKGSIELNVIPTSLSDFGIRYTCENDLSLGLTDQLKSIPSNTGYFDFEEIRTSIYNLYTNPDIEVSFYETAENAQLQSNPITGVNEYSNTEIIVVISNKLTKNCDSAGTLKLQLNSLPDPEGEDEPLILCVNNPIDSPQLISLNIDGSTSNSTDTFQWYLNNTPISGATSSNLDVFEKGTYKVEATREYLNNTTDTSDDNYCSAYNTFIIEESNSPLITIDDLTIIDDSTNNSITINASNLGIGNYWFALDNGSYQDEPYFDNISPGIHQIYVADQNGCSPIVSIEVPIIGFPKFFTPNGDGLNDTWQIQGLTEGFYANSKIYIFDRFGKLVAKVNPESEGWDGLFNNKTLPSTDYWFSIELIDSNGNVKLRKGHFSLIR